jgi:hypothetical protein
VNLTENGMMEQELIDNPSWRCSKCIANNRPAINGILEVVLLESGQYRLLIDYLGYKFHELDKYSVFDPDDYVGTDALIEAYQRHAATRATHSLLFCVDALLEAIDQAEPLE